jgi:hypothetical protein
MAKIVKNYFLITLSNVMVFTCVLIAAGTHSIAGLANESEVPNPPCAVNDPTGTPLNVRSEPNGKIIARLKNGTIVEPTNTPLRDKWEEIQFSLGNRRITGWVFRNYLGCQ